MISANRRGFSMSWASLFAICVLYILSGFVQAFFEVTARHVFAKEPAAIEQSGVQKMGVYQDTNGKNELYLGIYCDTTKGNLLYVWSTNQSWNQDGGVSSQVVQNGCDRKFPEHGDQVR